MRTKEIIELVKFIDIKNQEIKIITAGSEVGNDLISYDIIDDNTINVGYGWNGYEEDESNNLHIVVGDMINVNHKCSGYSGEEGDYDDSEDLVFKNINGVIELIKEYH